MLPIKGALLWKIGAWFVLVNLVDPGLPLKSIIIVNSIAAIPATVAAFLSWHNKKKAEEIHLQINSRFDQFLKLAQDASFAQGQLAETKKAAEAKASFDQGAQTEKDKQP